MCRIKPFVRTATRRPKAMNPKTASRTAQTLPSGVVGTTSPNPTVVNDIAVTYRVSPAKHPAFRQSAAIVLRHNTDRRNWYCTPSPAGSIRPRAESTCRSTGNSSVVLPPHHSVTNNRSHRPQNATAIATHMNDTFTHACQQSCRACFRFFQQSPNQSLSRIIAQSALILFPPRDPTRS